MEFNTINKAFEITELQNIPEEEKVVLKSMGTTTLNSIPERLRVEVKESHQDMNVIVDTRDIINNYDNTLIEKSLISIYGKSGRIYSTGRSFQTIVVPKSVYPAKLIYDLVILINNTRYTFTVEYPLPLYEISTNFQLIGRSQSSTVETNILGAIPILDEEIIYLKEMLGTLSLVNSISNPEININLHQFLKNIELKLETISKEIDDLKEKTKDL